MFKAVDTIDKQKTMGSRGVEIWKDIVGYEGFYKVSDLGKVKSVKKDIILKAAKDRRGYHLLSLRKNGKRKTVRVHRLVGEAFAENPNNKGCINHINGNKDDNQSTNLEWVTYSENTNHAYKTGLKIGVKSNKYGKNQGTKLKHSKLTEEKGRYIRKNAKAKGGEFTNSELAIKFCISGAVISSVIKRKSWKHVL